MNCSVRTATVKAFLSCFSNAFLLIIDVLFENAKISTR